MHFLSKNIQIIQKFRNNFKKRINISRNAKKYWNKRTKKRNNS